MKQHFQYSVAYLVFKGKICGFMASLIAFDDAKLVKINISCKFSGDFSTIRVEKMLINV